MPFVSFEGIDGSGKTTQLGRLAAWLEGQGQRVVRTKEPDGGRLGRDVRAVLIKERSFPLDPIEELLLVSTARYDHVRSVIRPALTTRDWVLSDRFVDSTFALQVYAAGAPEALLNTVNALVTGETRPDITFILDLSPEDAYFRRMNRDGQSAYDPAESTRDFQRVRQGFQVRAQAEPWRCKLIDAHRDEASVADTILTELRGAGLLPA